ncbi:Glucuronide permease [Citrobacter werkmanii]|uniref:Glucuronide permease n=1 Tax=Citrobacter werkmanii TaxID=67827 RepID=A0ABN7HC32_9ENTR|nr:Glucuronide permease [Citrobacter werkmanii]
MGALFLLSYYTDVAGVGAAAAGTMLLLVRVFDAFADVSAGRIVDSVNTRWGKFRPFLLFGSAPLMAFSVLVFCVPAEWSHSSKVIYAYITYMGLGICYSLVNIPYGSLAAAMTQQPQSRARLGAARSIAASLTFVCWRFSLGHGLVVPVRLRCRMFISSGLLSRQLQVLCCISSVLNRPKKMSCVSWRSLR